ncbi:MAG: hypothetical protein H6649_06035 [Caldilineae bacterium]|nr:hypothetical protein [Anaerolineae bacterium]MCB9153602.1 hypothetical protein [Caldilineae bacterium]
MNTQPSRLRASTCGLLALVLLLSVLLPVAATAAPAASPCAPGAAYDQACDVDHDGDVDVMDIQLAAGHFNQSGNFNPSDNNHDHLGQTWTGSNTPLTISGTFNSWPDAYSPLVLINPGGYGVWVYEAGNAGVTVDEAGTHAMQVLSAGLDGVHVVSAGDDGINIETAGDDGFVVEEAGDVGVFVGSAGDDGVSVQSASNNGVRVASAGSAGVRVQQADGAGVYVNSAGGDGIFVCATGSNSGCNATVLNNGVEIGNAEDHGVRVNSAGRDGVRVNSAGDDGVFVASADGAGVYVAEADLSGVYANTIDANDEWGLYTPDKISGSNVTLSSLTVIAQVAGEQALSTGDVVAAVGVTEPLPDSIVPLALVRLADATTANGIVGVVEGRMALTAQPQHGDEEDAKPVMELRSAEGPAQPGDYVALTVLGVAQVKVQEGAAIQPGQRLTASDIAGRARALRTETLNGMIVSEGAPVIGTALAAPEPDKDTIPVFVTLR